MGFSYDIRPLKFRYSLLIYTVSKKSEKEEGENYQSVLLAIINKVFDRSGIHGIIINSRILKVFRKKNILPRESGQESKCGFSLRTNGKYSDPSSSPKAVEIFRSRPAKEKR